MPPFSINTLQANLNLAQKRSVLKCIQIDGVTKSLDLTAKLTTLSSSQIAIDDCLNHLRCKKGGSVNVLMLTEPFEIALGRKRR